MVRLLLSYLAFWKATPKNGVSACFSFGVNVVEIQDEDYGDPRVYLRLLIAMNFNCYRFGVFFTLIVFLLIVDYICVVLPKLEVL